MLDWIYNIRRLILLLKDIYYFDKKIYSLHLDLRISIFLDSAQCQNNSNTLNYFLKSLQYEWILKGEITITQFQLITRV